MAYENEKLPPPSYASDIDIMIWYVDCTKAFRNKAEGERYESQEPSACVFISYPLSKESYVADPLITEIKFILIESA